MIRISIAVGLALVLGGCAERNPEAEQAAFKATEAWLALVDAGDFEASWEISAPSFKGAESRESWAAKARGYREPLGALQSRQLNTTSYFTNLWGAPDGEYTIVVYDSHWEAGAIFESITMQRQLDGLWLVAGYKVRQQ